MSYKKTLIVSECDDKSHLYLRKADMKLAGRPWLARAGGLHFKGLEEL